MKVLGSYIFRAICSVLVGFLLVFNPDQMTLVLVQVIGGLFLLSGLVTLVNYVVVRSSSTGVVRPLFPVVGLGSALFGLFLAFFPGYFITYLMFLLGGLLIIAGISQVTSLVGYRKIMPLSWKVFLVPVLLLAAGALILFNPLSSASLPFTILGICCIVYGISDIVNGIRLRRYMKRYSGQLEYEEVG